MNNLHILECHLYILVVLESFSRCSRWILEKATIICFRFYSLCWIDRNKSAPCVLPALLLSCLPHLTPTLNED